MNAAEIAGVLQMLGRVYPNWKADAGTADVWLRLLSDQDGPTIMRAAIEYARESEFAPTPAALIRLARPIDGRPIALEAWGEVVRWIPLGPNVRPRFTHPDVEIVVEMLGGYEVLCVDGLSNPSHRARFADAWEQVGRREDRIDRRREADSLVESLGLSLPNGPGPKKLL